MMDAPSRPPVSEWAAFLARKGGHAVKRQEKRERTRGEIDKIYHCNHRAFVVS